MRLSRRKFARLAASTSALAITGFPAIWTAAKSRRNRLILKGGLVYDGLGNPPVKSDIAIQDDRILAVDAAVPSTGAEILEVTGLAVAPGFIDIHSHSDLSVLVNPNAESKLRQGVTTEVVGQDGSSIGPWTDATFESIRDRYRSSYEVLIDFRNLGEYFARLEVDRPSVNIASMIGAGTVRASVIGDEEREATRREIETMVYQIEHALEDGACGMSSGLEYVPGAFAETDELIALAGPLADSGLPYATHMRNEDDELFAGVEEALHIGRMAGVPVHISHLKAIGKRNWWKVDLVLEMLDRAGDVGPSVTFDRYPYVAYSTTLASLFPIWSREGGTDAFIERLENRDLGVRIRAEVEAKINRLGDWNSVQVTSTREDSLSWANGRRIGELADARGIDPYELTTKILIDDQNRTNMIGFGMSEENTERFLSHPRGVICSDAAALAPYGYLSAGSPHPRAYGSFPRVLGYYCRDREIMPIETAIMKMTSMPADLVQLSKRGRIVEGAFADIVVFDPRRISDQATFDDPDQYPAGIEFVFVNGQAAVRRGRHTESHAGRVLRPPRRRR